MALYPVCHPWVMDDVGKKFAAAVRAARTHRGLSQMALAERIGASVDAVSAIERGINTPSLATAAALVRELAIDANALFGKTDYRTDIVAQRLVQEAELVLLAETLDADGIKLLVELARVLGVVHTAAPKGDATAAATASKSKS
jgi:transcriptional regulator with XRE-family HTH domain